MTHNQVPPGAGRRNPGSPGWKRFILTAWLRKPPSVEPDDGRVGRHDQECTPRNSLEFAAETENETRDKIDHARGIRVVHFLQVDEYRNFPEIVLTDGGGIPKVSQTYYCDLGTVAHGKLVIGIDVAGECR
jgi:hypothetical protein